MVINIKVALTEALSLAVARDRRETSASRSTRRHMAGYVKH